MNTRISLASLAVLAAFSASANAELVDGSAFAQSVIADNAAYDGEKDHVFDLTNVNFNQNSAGTIYGAAVWGDSEASATSAGDMNILVKNDTGGATALGTVVFSNSQSGKYTHGGTLNLEAAGTVNVSADSVSDATAIAVMRSTNNTDAHQSFMNINAKTVYLTAHSKSGYAAGIWAQNNNTTDETPSKLTINADHTYISVSSDIAEPDSAGEYHDIGIVAYSGAQVEINGSLTIDARTAISTRGNAATIINKDGTGNVQINGDIIFYYDAPTSGTPVDAKVDINLSGASSYLNGDIFISGNPQPPVGKDQVNKMELSLSDGASWTTDRNDSFVNVLEMDNGIVNLAGGEEQRVSIGTLSGAGTFNVNTSTEDGKTFKTAKFSAESVAEGANITLAMSGLNADDVQDADAALTALGESFTATEGTAAQTRIIQEGDIRGAILQSVDAQGNVGEKVVRSNTKLDAYQGVNSVALVQWRNEINHLTKRLGDIRNADGDIGAWARVYGGESQWGGSNEVEMDHTTIQVGGDYRINDHWIAGGAFSYTDSDADLSNGSADGDSYSLAAYATYMADGGSFLDLIARYGYLKNDFTAGNMDLDTSSNAFSLSAEMGHTFRFIEDRAYVEPQFEFTYGFISGDDATASNGVKIDQDDFQSFITRVGVRAGYDFPEKKGSFYGMFSYSYDWLGDADGVASKDGIRKNLSEDLGGGWVTYGIGAQFMMGESAYFYGELERTSGGDIDNPYLFSAGVRMVF